MSTRAFHHGNLRQELLDRAEAMLRKRGIEALSLRELAREAGVSHGAPRSHFPDKAALLDALAARGYERLADRAEGLAHADLTPRERLLALGRAHLDFALRDAALADLMYAAKAAGPSPIVEPGVHRLYAASSTIVSTSLESLRGEPVDPLRTTLLMSSMTQGIASLIGSGRIPAELGEVLVSDAVDLFESGQLPS
ncbi:TetR family transcriptional regulator [Gordonia sp. HNM0687]|uniref:TetR family transcriptional regulator n=1 Tax=Gordonia mangrovi TaxID=2665643 RepID=A0A6L7GK02_9ACTN|nr:TetR/AcrR family transcriptional regulator [Gordonia mangrovi]MXP20260.1 TetR family transcriptional regulator [Gordonia mangrovi]UVF79135.1 TetR/AcrR family transcriptional regulator [Gordonia mangrovi]